MGQRRIREPLCQTDWQIELGLLTRHHPNYVFIPSHYHTADQLLVPHWGISGSGDLGAGFYSREAARNCKRLFAELTRGWWRKNRGHSERNVETQVCYSCIK